MVTNSPPLPGDCPPCPKCKSAHAVYPDGERNWWCGSCKFEFDDDPDEGGDYSTDPTRRAERNEQYDAKKAGRGAKGKPSFQRRRQKGGRRR